MAHPTEYTSRVSIPLPSEDEVRKVMGDAYDPAKTLNVIKMFAGTDDMYAATVGLVNAVFATKGIDPKKREMIILRTAKVLDCPYEWQANARFASNAGLSDDEIEAAATDGPVRGVDPEYVLLCRATDEMCTTGTLTDQTVADMLRRYDTTICRHYLISTVGVPAIGKVVEASRERPYLSFRLVLDPSVVTSVLVESGVTHPRGDGSGVKAIDVSPLDTNLLDATLRLVRLTDTPGEYRALAPLVIREIIYRLLTDTQANRLRHLATVGGHAHRVVRAVKRLNEDFAKPLRIEDIAHELGMSVSGFHAHFKAVTAMSPLQFQKQLRLQEARRLMLSEHLDAREAGYRVGYDDQSHFSREYRRHFGEPPIRDVERLRALATT
jgi:AraC-like DNA-binding protein/alkylhydroperoxidase family enzyme